MVLNDRWEGESAAALFADYLKEKMSDIIQIGFIPEDWEKNSDGEFMVFIGDTDSSGVKEAEIHLDDDFFAINDEKHDWDNFDEVVSQLTNTLSAGAKLVDDIVVANIWALFLDELEEEEESIVFDEEGMWELDNEDHDFNGHFYFRRIQEEDGEIEYDRTVVVNA